MTVFERTCEAVEGLFSKHPEIDRSKRIYIHNAMHEALDLQRRDLLREFEATLERIRGEQG